MRGGIEHSISQHWAWFLLIVRLSVIGAASSAAAAPAGSEVTHGEARLLDAHGIPTRLTYKVNKKGYALVEDMVLGEHRKVQQSGGWLSFSFAKYHKSQTRVKRGAFSENKGAVKIWRYNTVPYSLDKASPELRKAFYEAIEEFHHKTNVRFVPKSGHDTDYLDVETADPGEGLCAQAQVGAGEGARLIQFSGITECQTKYVVLHELMHALGFVHEHNRLDRDSHITLFSGNNIGTAYPILDYAQPVTPYDINSIMHYGYVFKTLTGEVIPQALTLSDDDIKAVNAKYPPNRETPEGFTSPSVFPEQVRLARGDSQDVTVRAPCDVLVNVNPLPEVKYSRKSCQGGQHVFRFKARQAIRFKENRIFIDVLTNARVGSTPEQRYRFALEMIPKAKIEAKTRVLVGAEILPISVYADCLVEVRPGGVSGLTIARSRCQAGQHVFNVLAVETVGKRIRKQLSFFIKYNRLASEAIYETVHEDIVIYPPIATHRTPAHLKALRQEVKSNAAESIEHLYYTSESRCVRNGDLGLAQGERAEIAQDTNSTNVHLGAAGRFNYKNVSQDKATDSFIALVTGSNGHKRRVQVTIKTTLDGPGVLENECWTKGDNATRSIKLPLPYAESHLPGSQAGTQISPLADLKLCIEAGHTGVSRPWGNNVSDLFMRRCRSTHIVQKWFYDTSTLAITNSAYPGYCLAKASAYGTSRQFRLDELGPAVLAPCAVTAKDEYQQWFWDNETKRIKLAKANLYLTHLNGHLDVLPPPPFDDRKEEAYRWIWRGNTNSDSLTGEDAR